MSAKSVILGQKCPRLGTETFLGDKGFVYKRLVDLDTGETVTESRVKNQDNTFIRLSTGRPSLLRLEPGIKPPDYASDRFAEINAANRKEDARRVMNYNEYLKGRNPCVPGGFAMHRTNIPERTYDGWWGRVD